MSSTPNVYTCSEVTSICQIQYSIYGYYPSLPANAFFLSLFTTLFSANLYLGFRYKTWTYAFALCCGCLIEAIGYIGRLILHQNPFSNLGFTMQICCLIMGPAWLAMGVYLTLKHVVKAYGAQYSYLRPQYYTWLFIGGDCVSLSLQAAGGGLSSGAQAKPNQLIIGDDLAITGIIMQVVTLTIFAALAVVFFLRRHLSLRKESDGPDPKGEQVDSHLRSLRFKLFLAAVTIAFLTIFTRCIYRIAEMIGGWGNPLMQDQGEFIALDSVMCGIAALALTVFHPGYCFPQMAQPISFGKGRVLGILGDSTSNTDASSTEVSEVDVEKFGETKDEGLYFR